MQIQYRLTADCFIYCMQRGRREVSKKEPTKGSSSEGAGNNNIHININLNVKKKSQCFHGRRVDNFIEIARPAPKEHIGSKAAKGQDPEQLKSKSRHEVKSRNEYEEVGHKARTVRKQTRKSKDKIASQHYTPKQEFTPEKERTEKRHQKSFEKTKRVSRAKESRSMENLKVHFKDSSSKNISRARTNFNTNVKSASNSKSRSRSRSSKKLLNQRRSSKQITSFQNSGVKKHLKEHRTEHEGDSYLKKSKSSLKGNKLSEHEAAKIREFMQEKKRKERREKVKNEKREERRAQKIKSELQKVELKRRENASKPSKRASHQTISGEDQLRLPMYFGEDDEFDESQDYDELKRAAHELIHHSEQNSRTHSTNGTYKAKTMASQQKSIVKSVQLSEYDLLVKGKLSSEQFNGLVEKMKLIQKVWRGYKVRKLLYKELSRIRSAASGLYRQIRDQNGNFWNGEKDQDNSIHFLADYSSKRSSAVEFEPKSHKHQSLRGYMAPHFDLSAQSATSDKQAVRGCEDQNALLHQTENRIERLRGITLSADNTNSNFHSVGTAEEHHTDHKKYMSESCGGSSEQRQESSKEELAFMDPFPASSCHNSSHKSQLSSKPKVPEEKSERNEILRLKAEMEKQRQMFARLEKQNSQLKENLYRVSSERQSVENSRVRLQNAHQEGKERWQMSPYCHQEVESLGVQSNDADVSIRGPLKRSDGVTQSNTQEIAQTKKTLPSKRPNLSLQITEEQMSEHSELSGSEHQAWKKRFEAYESPSSRRLHNQGLDNIQNLANIFKKKELSLEAAYEKSTQNYRKMLSNNIVSPKTYNFKKIQLDEKYQKQREKIREKKQSVEQVAKLISEEGEEEQQLLSQNNSGVQSVQKETEAVGVAQEGDFEAQNDSDASSEKYKKYWTDDMEEVHQKALEISRRIDEALEADSNRTASEYQTSTSNQEYNSQTSSFSATAPRKETIAEDRSEKQEDVGHKEALSSDSLKIKEQTAFQIEENASNELLAQSNQSEITVNLNPQQKIFSEESEEVFESRELSSPKDQLDPEANLEASGLQNNLSEVSVSSSKNSSHSSQYDIPYPKNSSATSSEQQTQKEGKKSHQNYVELVAHGSESQGEDCQSQFESNLSGASSQSSHSRRNSVHSSSQAVDAQSEENNEADSGVERGFDTRLTFIKEYLIALSEYVRSESGHRMEFMENISRPLSYDYFEYLKSYRTTLENENSASYNSQQESFIYPYFKALSAPTLDKAINEAVCDRFELLYQEAYQSDEELTQEMVAIRRHFLTLIFDVMNESLNYERPGGVHGEPLPWLCSSKNLKHNSRKYLASSSSLIFAEEAQEEHSQEEEEKLDRIFGLSITKVIEWGSCLCGFIPEPVSFDSNEAHQAVHIDDEQTELVRETRLAYMLEKSMVEGEEALIDRSKEDLEVMLHLQSVLFQALIQEAVQDCLSANQKPPGLTNQA